MSRYIIRRLLWAVALFFAVTAITYVIFFMIPADPAAQACGQRATPACVASARKFFGLDKPIYVQYYNFMKRLVVHQDLGHSFTNRQSVNEIVKEAAPVTASLVFGGAILWMLLALPVGVLSALRPRSLLDRGAMVFVLVGISAHPVWIGLLLVYFVSYKAGVTPISGYCNFFPRSGPPLAPNVHIFSSQPVAVCQGPKDWADRKSVV